MKKLLLLIALFTSFTLSELNAQSNGLSPEGYKSWIRAITIMEESVREIDYFSVIDEFENVIKFDPDYADVHYNIGMLYTKLGDYGGGMPAYEKAQRYFGNYLKLMPGEKSALAKELIQLDLKKENFMKNLGINMVKIDKGVYTEKGKPIEVESFYIQNYLFTVAQLKKIITPVSVRMTVIATGKTFSIPTQESPTGDDNVPYILTYITAEQIVEVINCVTGRDFFIPTINEWERIGAVVRSNPSGLKTLEQLGIYIGGEYLTLEAKRKTIYEWVNYSKEDKKMAFERFPFSGKSNNGGDPLARVYRRVDTMTDFHSPTEVRAFRLALPVYE